MRMRAILQTPGRALHAVATAWRRRPYDPGEAASTAADDRALFANGEDASADAFAPRHRPPSSNLLASLAVEVDDPRAHVFVAIVEIERFALLRQRIGFQLANELVVAFTARLTRELDGCQVGRVGRTSVEFAFPATSFDDASAKLERLVVRLERSIDVQHDAFDLFVTVGAADAGRNAIDDRLLDLAESALAQARRRHAKFWIAQAASDVEPEFDYVAIMRDLRDAMANGDLSLHYQPKLCAKTDMVKSCEALLRWQHPVHGMLRTDRLIEAAEVTGAIRAVTYWVIERALADQAELSARGHDVEVFVNISAILLPEQAFARWALAALASAKGRIGFEITETAVITDPTDAIANLQQFADAGIRIAIDDYGSGLSSLAYLKQLPAHELKIDQMFVSGLTESHRDPLLVRSTIDLAHALEMDVTAEGVDNPVALALLRIMGCDLLQGHEISKPLPFDEFELFLGEHTPAGVSRPVTWNVDGWAGQAPAELRYG